ncbi:MAG: hypothetical protein PVH24_08005 [Candidatus Zixiibacteriota bacterium]|jgi:hypothetical protein
MGNEQSEPGVQKKRKQPYWLLYISILLAGILLLADAAGYAPLQRLTARLGIALVLSAFALVIGNGRQMGYWATGIIWVAVIITFFV